jgi:hypothetical protein
MGSERVFIRVSGSIISHSGDGVARVPPISRAFPVKVW